MRKTLVILSFLLTSPVNADQVKQILSSQFADLDAIPVCYDFGCKSRTVVRLTPEEWQSVTGWFNPVAETAQQERHQIKQAIGWMEVLIGRYTPTHKDLAFSLPPQDEFRHLFPGQQDCIDESVNTTIYLELLEQEGLLAHHEVVEPAYRQSLFDQHWASQIRESKTGEQYVVDSWFRPNGHVPAIQHSEKWQDLSLRSAFASGGETESNRLYRSGKRD